jgi:signal transduction histidine kinase
LVPLRPLVQKIVEALGRTLAERKAEIAIRELSPAWGDPTALEQIFANLIGNAVNYLDSTRPGRIEVGEVAVQTNDQRTYYIRDNGRGIPEAHRSKLFIAFQRLHPDAAPGEGIGLALVRRMVERHGGSIWVESESGVGSTFYVSLPAQPTGAGPASTDATAKPVQTEAK